MNNLFSLMSTGMPLLMIAIFGGIFGILILFFVLSMLRARAQVRASQDWPSVDGQIMMSQIEYRRSGRSGGAYYPVVLYRYQVNGQTYQNNRIRFGMSMGFGNPNVSQGIVNQYPVGSVQPVYYDPYNPASAVLNRTTGSSNRALGCIVVALVAGIAFTVAMTVFTSNISQVIQSFTKSFTR